MNIILRLKKLFFISTCCNKEKEEINITNIEGQKCQRNRKEKDKLLSTDSVFIR